MPNLPIRLREYVATGVMIAVLASVGAGCGTSKPPADAPREEAPEEDTRPGDPAPPAPWRNGALDAASVPDVYLEQWQEAQNRGECALIAPASLGDGEGATVRSAYFGGGWGVAYDLPGRRSAFGVAGTGADAAGASYDEWPFGKEWADGSSAGYGPEGGSGPNQMAYLRLPGQGCLYNVWSRLGVDHLEVLLEQLRFVQTPP